MYKRQTLYSIFSDLGAYTMEYMIENFECLDKSKFGMHTNRKYCPQIEEMCIRDSRIS